MSAMFSLMETMLWTLPTDCGEILGYYIDFLYGCSLMSFIFCIDIVTVLFLRKARNRIKTANDRIRLRRDLGYFAQVTIFKTIIKLQSYRRLQLRGWLSGWTLAIMLLHR
jgi:hypothetical protein